MERIIQQGCRCKCKIGIDEFIIRSGLAVSAWYICGGAGFNVRVCGLWTGQGCHANRLGAQTSKSVTSSVWHNLAQCIMIAVKPAADTKDLEGIKA